MLGCRTATRSRQETTAEGVAGSGRALRRRRPPAESAAAKCAASRTARFGWNPAVQAAAEDTSTMRPRRPSRASADDRWARLVAVVGLAAFVIAVYVVIVVGGSVLVGRT